MKEPKKPTKYTINAHIRDITEEQLKEYAAKQGMTITGVLNSAIWYCCKEDVDLAIWTIKERRKADGIT